jgi:hypothetical protein
MQTKSRKTQTSPDFFKVNPEANAHKFESCLIGRMFRIFLDAKPARAMILYRMDS